MSAIAGIFSASGRPIEAGQIDSMLEPMRRRGPDRVTTWQSATTVMGHCRLRSTPDASHTQQPHASADGQVVLVLDGQVHNRDELLSALRSAGAPLRNSSDAELVLHAYETWGAACPDRIVGEFAFFVWDARQMRLFGARDAAGARHFYYHRTAERFAFASEIRGLLALPDVERRLNPSRLLDVLVSDFDRDDQVGTLYLGIERLPAGHAMQIDRSGMESWRYWDPRELAPSSFASMQACGHEFMAVLDVAVAARLRHTRPLGVMLSGGLDSSTIVGLISARHAAELAEPLRTFSLALEDRTSCGDWQAVSEILRHNPALQSCVVGSDQGEAFAHRLDQALADADEPFGVVSAMPYQLLFEAAHASGCQLIFDGMAGDLLFFSPEKTLATVLGDSRLDLAPGLAQAMARHGMLASGMLQAARSIAGRLTPATARTAWRARARERRLRSGVLGLLRPQVARTLLDERESAYPPVPTSQIGRHASTYTSGLLSFAQERNGLLAGQFGMETLSPFADRRVIEFALRMPLEAKLMLPWYKHLLRNGTQGLLPDSVRWRRSLEGHPGWHFYERMWRGMSGPTAQGRPIAEVLEALDPWIDVSAVSRNLKSIDEQSAAQGQDALSLVITAKWLRLKEIS